MTRATRSLLPLLIALTLGAPGLLQAQALRFALVAGANRGSERLEALRYAERDARRVARILTELGGVDEARLTLEAGASRSDVLEGLSDLDARIRAAQAAEHRDTILIVYFSGHADGVHVELGASRLTFEELRAAVEATAADLKIVILDTCHSGRITSAKGASPAPGFDVVLVDTLDTDGLAVITSSAGTEAAQESEALEGSFFTHHLLSALYGAADVNGDARVTLGEAYRYAYNKTVLGTLLTTRGPQHPTFDYELTGRGDVVLTFLLRGEATLRFGPDTAGSFLVVDAALEEVVAEIDKGAGTDRRLVLRQGTYWVAERRDGRVFIQDVALARGAEVAVDRAAMEERELSLAALKGARVSATSLQLFAHYGMTSGALRAVGAVHQGNLGLRVDAGPVSLFPRFAYGRTEVEEQGLRYSMTLVSLESYLAWRFEFSPLDLFAGLNLGVAYGSQRLMNGEEHEGSTFVYGVVGGLDVPLWEGLALHMFWELDGHVFSLNQSATLQAFLKGALGLAWAF